jgi:hypothetical protein
MKGTGALAAVTAALLFAQAGVAQTRMIQFDVNNLAFQAQNAAGAPVPFGGVSHTGALVLSETLPTTQLVAISIRDGVGPFVEQGGAPWNLTDVSMTINLVNGMVTGGSFLLDINGGPAAGDRYSAAIGAGGAVSPFVGGGFKIEGLTQNGLFSDAAFGPINIADFFAAQGTPPFLTGSFLNFKIQPTAGGSGFADVDAFVSNIPTPGSIACMAMGLVIARRRRR